MFFIKFVFWIELNCILYSFRDYTQDVMGAIQLFICFGIIISVWCVKPPIIQTPMGNVQGYWAESLDGRSYAAYEGIPYAEKPIGDLRFEAPLAIKKWPQLVIADKIIKCPQTTFDLKTPPFGDEDCLYLNIYVPEVNTSNLLDVIVHIHGGAFSWGYGPESTDSKYVMDRDFIFITIHYRIGALGFLCTEDEIVPGNMGLKDQVVALQWIRDNIQYFKGNKNSVTITGYSSGAASTHLHYFSAQSRGLFHRGMSHSGTALNFWALQRNALQRAKLLGTFFKCPTNTSKLLIDCLKLESAYSIVNATVHALYAYPPFPTVQFAPVIEKYGKNPFLSDHPYKIMQKEGVLDVPWIASHISQDGYVATGFLLSKLADLNANWTEKSQYVFQYGNPSGKDTEIASKVRQYYFGDKELDKSTFMNLTQLATDRLFRVDGELAAYLQSNLTSSPIFYYSFGYVGTNSFKNFFIDSSYSGAGHGEDVMYLYGGGIFRTKPFSEKDIKMRNIALDTLYSYAHNGVPTISNVTWNPINKDFLYLNITGPDEIKMERKDDFATDDFWNGLGLLENAGLFLDKFT